MDRATTTKENTMNRADHTEFTAYQELQTAIAAARKLLDQTDAWADAWHSGKTATPPFSVGGSYAGSALADVIGRAASYRAAAEAKATPLSIWTVTVERDDDDGSPVVRAFHDEKAANEYAQTEADAPSEPTWHDNDGSPVYTNGREHSGNDDGVYATVTRHDG